MKAKVRKEFPGRPDNESTVRTIRVGEVISGDLACVAIAEGWAKEVDDATGKEPKAKAGNNKAPAGDGLDELSDDDLAKIVSAELVPEDVPAGADRTAVIDIIRAKRQG